MSWDKTDRLRRVLFTRKRVIHIYPELRKHHKVYYKKDFIEIHKETLEVSCWTMVDVHGVRFRRFRRLKRYEERLNLTQDDLTMIQEAIQELRGKKNELEHN